mmetsp:Transcript_51743/g.110653  ORF Transcript_51743/g.110653 Transcript_51743/m.110653 type:complete len:325 (+) Transcript_51743:79-1053(+)
MPFTARQMRSSASPEGKCSKRFCTKASIFSRRPLQSSCAAINDPHCRSGSSPSLRADIFCNKASLFQHNASTSAVVSESLRRASKASMRAPFSKSARSACNKRCTKSELAPLKHCAAGATSEEGGHGHTCQVLLGPLVGSAAGARNPARGVLRGLGVRVDAEEEAEEFSARADAEQPRAFRRAVGIVETAAISAGSVASATSHGSCIRPSRRWGGELRNNSLPRCKGCSNTARAGDGSMASDSQTGMNSELLRNSPPDPNNCLAAFPPRSGTIPSPDAPLRTFGGCSPTGERALAAVRPLCPCNDCEQHGAAVEPGPLDAAGNA